MKARTIRLLFALAALVLLAIIPAAAVAFRSGSAPYRLAAASNYLEPHYGRAAALYWSAAPRSIVIFLIATMTFLPLVAGFLVLSDAELARARGRSAAIESLRLLGWITALNVASHLAFLGVSAVAGIDRFGVSWALQLCLATSLGVLPYVAFTAVIRRFIARHLVAFTLGAVTIALTALVALWLTESGRGIWFTPAFVRRMALSGYWDDTALAALGAGIWLSVASVAITVRRGAKNRPQANHPDANLALGSTGELSALNEGPPREYQALRPSA
ncbi:MAG TPA: hypothetical protein VI072_17600 [Polyangiaceae bacterium]